MRIPQVWKNQSTTAIRGKFQDPRDKGRPALQCLSGLAAYTYYRLPGMLKVTSQLKALGCRHIFDSRMYSNGTNDPHNKDTQPDASCIGTTASDAENYITEEIKLHKEKNSIPRARYAS